MFRDVLNIKDVEAVILFSFEGRLLFKEFLTRPADELETRGWWQLFIHSLEGVREVDMVFEKRRIYMRKTELGYLMVLTGPRAPVAMVRLHCDILLPSLKKENASKGLARFFKWKK